MSTQMDAYLTLLLEEYKTLQEAAAQAGKNTYLSLQWGSATLAVLVAAAVTQWRQHDAAVELVFLLAVPFLGSMAMLFFVGELARIRRVADYLCATELKAKLLVSTRMDPGDLESELRAELMNLERIIGLRYPVKIGLAPLGWERWLVELRKKHAGAASGHLTWVYRTRFALYPIVIASSIAVAMYYGLSGDTHVKHAHTFWLMAVVGIGFSVFAVWFAIELAVDLARITPYASGPPTPVRRAFRRLFGWLFQIGEWRRPQYSASADVPETGIAPTAG
jgi:hypothetical protein